MAAPVAKKRPSTSTLGTIAINDIIATRTHPITVSDGSVTVSVGNQDSLKTSNSTTTGRIGYGMLEIGDKGGGLYLCQLVLILDG